MRSRWKCIVAFAARGARRKSQQGHVIPAVLTASKRTGLFQREAIKLGIVFDGRRSSRLALKNRLGLRACDQFVGDAAVAQRERDLRLVEDIGQFAGTKHLAWYLTTTAPAFVAQPRATSAGYCLTESRPVARASPDRKFSTNACASRSTNPPFLEVRWRRYDQRDIPVPLLDDTVCQLDAALSIFRILELRRSRINSGHWRTAEISSRKNHRHGPDGREMDAGLEILT